MNRVVIALCGSVLLSGCNNAEKDAVRANLFDPDAAQFQNIEKCFADKAMSVGEVNAKNLHGAFTGFKPFFVKERTVTFVDDAQFNDTSKKCFGEGNDRPIAVMSRQVEVGIASLEAYRSSQGSESGHR